MYSMIVHCIALNPRYIFERICKAVDTRSSEVKGVYTLGPDVPHYEKLVV